MKTLAEKINAFFESNFFYACFGGGTDEFVQSLKKDLELQLTDKQEATIFNFVSYAIHEVDQTENDADDDCTLEFDLATDKIMHDCAKKVIVFLTI
jgi:hypothetical protein